MNLSAEQIVDPFKKLREKKAKIEKRFKVLQEKSRKAKIKRYIQVGTLASQFDLDGMDDADLIGAFSEMKELAKQPDTLSRWKKIAESFSKTQRAQLLVSFDAKEPSDEIKRSLKEKGFKWNSFRKEWYGYGNKGEIESLVKPFQGNVEDVSD